MGPKPMTPLTGEKAYNIDTTREFILNSGDAIFLKIQNKNTKQECVAKIFKIP